jgi:serine acetyltransferase
MMPSLGHFHFWHNTIQQKFSFRAGSVVTKDVPAGATVVGNPARQIAMAASKADNANKEDEHKN